MNFTRHEEDSLIPMVLSHLVLDGHNCPSLQFDFEGRSYCYLSQPDAISIQQSHDDCLTELFDWKYDHANRVWLRPVYADLGDPASNAELHATITQILVIVGQFFNSPQALAYFAGLRAATPLTGSPFNALLQAHTQHFRADRALTPMEYLSVRCTPPPPRPAPAPVKFVPDLSGLSPSAAKT